MASVMEVEPFPSPESFENIQERTEIEAIFTEFTNYLFHLHVCIKPNDKCTDFVEKYSSNLDQHLNMTLHQVIGYVLDDFISYLSAKQLESAGINSQWKQLRKCVLILTAPALQFTEVKQVMKRYVDSWMEKVTDLELQPKDLKILDIHSSIVLTWAKHSTDTNNKLMLTILKKLQDIVRYHNSIYALSKQIVGFDYLITTLSKLIEPDKLTKPQREGVAQVLRQLYNLLKNSPFQLMLLPIDEMLIILLSNNQQCVV